MTCLMDRVLSGARTKLYTSMLGAFFVYTLGLSMLIFKKKSSWRFLGKSSKLWALHKKSFHPCPAQNSVYQTSHCSALLIGCVKFFSRLYLNIGDIFCIYLDTKYANFQEKSARIFFVEIRKFSIVLTLLQ